MLRANKTMSRPISTTYYVHIKNIRLDKEGYSNVLTYKWRAGGRDFSRLKKSEIKSDRKKKSNLGIHNSLKTWSENRYTQSENTVRYLSRCHGRQGHGGQRRYHIVSYVSWYSHETRRVPKSVLPIFKVSYLFDLRLGLESVVPPPYLLVV